MKVVIQKVKQASVSVENQVISRIQQGLMVLVGISKDDTQDDVSKTANKILKMRLFEDVKENPGTKTKWIGKPWAKSVKDVGGEILSISQFTLYGNVRKGTKPDFHVAMGGDLAKNLYDLFLTELKRGLGDDKVKDGQFGAMMDVSLINEGPVTIIYDTHDKK